MAYGCLGILGMALSLRVVEAHSGTGIFASGAMFGVRCCFPSTGPSQLALSPRNLADPSVCRPTGDNEEARGSLEFSGPRPPLSFSPTPIIRNSEAIVQV